MVLYPRLKKKRRKHLAFITQGLPSELLGIAYLLDRFVSDEYFAGVQVWVVDTEDDARRLIDWGVDALITDRPDVLVPLVQSAAGDRLRYP